MAREIVVETVVSCMFEFFFLKLHFLHVTGPNEYSISAVNDTSSTNTCFGNSLITLLYAHGLENSNVLPCKSEQSLLRNSSADVPPNHVVITQCIGILEASHALIDNDVIHFSYVVPLERE